MPIPSCPAWELRAASVRWKRLSALLGLIERCVEANGRLDAYRGEHGRPLQGHVRSVDARLAMITRRLGVEVSRLTQERLRLELQRRQAAASVAS